MELTWPIKIRIGASAALGIVVIGIFAWPIVASPDPFVPVSIISGAVSAGDVAVLLVLAFCTGLVAYFLVWPYGRQIGILAVPAGLAVWAMRTADLTATLQATPSISFRRQLFEDLAWEPLLWLAVAAAGFIAVLLAARIKSPLMQVKEQLTSSRAKYTSLAFPVAFVGSAVLGQFIIGLLAQDVRIADQQVGPVVGQPAAGQIVFAVLAAFGLVAFVAKCVFDLDYLPVVLASAAVNALAIVLYGRPATLEPVISRYPAPFFSSPVLAILPIQCVAYGTLGSIAGYWLAVRYSFWRGHREHTH